MEIRETQYGVLLILAVALLILFIHPVYASDELFLTGIVKRVDLNKKTVVVDVRSQSCHGIREFTVDDASQLDDFVDQRIDFSIDSSTCEPGGVYKMFPGGR